MKWAVVILAVFVLAQGVSIALGTRYFMQRADHTDAYLAQQFAYADSIMVECDGDPGLAWTQVAGDARAARRIMAAWLTNPPWQNSLRAHAVAINETRAVVDTLRSKPDLAPYVADHEARILMLEAMEGR